MNKILKISLLCLSLALGTDVAYGLNFWQKLCDIFSSKFDCCEYNDENSGKNIENIITYNKSENRLELKPVDKYGTLDL